MEPPALWMLQWNKHDFYLVFEIWAQAHLELLKTTLKTLLENVHQIWKRSEGWEGKCGTKLTVSEWQLYPKYVPVISQVTDEGMLKTHQVLKIREIQQGNPGTATHDI